MTHYYFVLAKRNRVNHLDLGIPRIVTTPSKEDAAASGAVSSSSSSSSAQNSTSGDRSSPPEGKKKTFTATEASDEVFINEKDGFYICESFPCWKGAKGAKVHRF
jgi:hypothetical protein